MNTKDIRWVEIVIYSKNVLSNVYHRYYYTVEDSKDKPDEYLGAIPLRFIYEVNMLDPKEYKRKDFPFRI